MKTLKSLVAAGREREDVALDAADRAAPYSYREFCTNAWKGANLLGQYGAHPGSEIAVLVGPKATTAGERTDHEGVVDAAEPLLGILASTLVGATARLGFDPAANPRALVLPWGWYETVAVDPSCSVLAYGGPPEEPSVAHFEAELWSQNPMEPPEPVEGETDAIAVGERTATHREVLADAERVVDAYDLSETSHVGLARPLDGYWALVAGVLAPLSVGATIQLARSPEQVLDDVEGLSFVLTSENSANLDERCVTPGELDVERSS